MGRRLGYSGGRATSSLPPWPNVGRRLAAAT